MFNNLKAALLDQEFHKKLLQQVVLSAVVAVVAVSAKQVAEVIGVEIQAKIAEAKSTSDPIEVA